MYVLKSPKGKFLENGRNRCISPAYGNPDCKDVDPMSTTFRRGKPLSSSDDLHRSDSGAGVNLEEMHCYMDPVREDQPPVFKTTTQLVTMMKHQVPSHRRQKLCSRVYVQISGAALSLAGGGKDRIDRLLLILFQSIGRVRRRVPVP